MRKAEVQTRTTFEIGPKLEGYEFTCLGFRFVVHRAHRRLGVVRGWLVTEPQTGFAVLGQYISRRTRAEAVRDAQKILRKHGRKKVQAAIEKGLRKVAA